MNSGMFKSYILVLISLIIGNSGLAIPISGIQVGAAEKGLKLGFFSNTNEREQFGFGLQFFKGEAFRIEINDLSNSGIKLTSLGSNLSYSYFLVGNSSGNGIFMRGGLDLQRLEARAEVNLESLNFDASGVKVTCKTCGKIQLETINPFLNIIPSVGIGWQNKISDKIFVQLFVGAQYYSPPEISWNSSKKLPFFARQEAKRIVSRLNRQVNEYGDIFPHASIVIYHRF